MGSGGRHSSPTVALADKRDARGEPAMRRVFRSFGVFVFGLATASGAAAQSNSPSIDVTLGFIRDKIAQQGQINYGSSTHDATTNQTWANQFTVEASNVSADPSDCTVGFHWHSTVDGKQASDLDTAIRFKIVTSVQVSSMTDDIARLNADGGHTSWTSQISPAITVVLLRKSDGHTNTADFRDHDMAERVAKAMRHAADVCGGTTSVPF
jgi:hypothetical protein